MNEKRAPSHELDRFILRLPDGMRDEIKEAAKENNRSMNAEIVSRLEAFSTIWELEKTIEIQKIANELYPNTIEKLRIEIDELTNEINFLRSSDAKFKNTDNGSNEEANSFYELIKYEFEKNRENLEILKSAIDSEKWFSKRFIAHSIAYLDFVRGRILAFIESNNNKEIDLSLLREANAKVDILLSTIFDASGAKSGKKDFMDNFFKMSPYKSSPNDDENDVKEA